MMAKTIKQNIGIVGAGKVGTAMGVHAQRAGYRIAAIASRRESSAIAAAKRIDPTGTIAINPADMTGCDIVLLTVSDDQITGVCEKLAKQNFFAPNSTVAHCSGAFAADLLVAARDICQGHIACLHPLQTFPNVESGIASLPKAFFICQGKGKGLEVVETLAGDIGSGAIRINPGDRSKALYHASAVMACNYLTSLIDAAEHLAQLAGMDKQLSRDALMPLIETTIDNIRNQGTAQSLTGPVSRADCQTVSRHIQALIEVGADEKLIDLYRAAGQWTVDLATRNISITDQQAGQLRDILAGADQQKETTK